MNSFSFQLRRWRLVKRMTQGELASRAGVPRPNLVAIELGRRDCTVSTLECLARGLGITPSLLLNSASPRKGDIFLNRHGRERVVRYLLLGKGSLKKAEQKFSDNLLPLVRPILEANGLLVSAKGSRLVRRHEYHVSLLYSDELVAAVIDRVRKLVPLYARKEDQ